MPREGTVSPLPMQMSQGTLSLEGIAVVKVVVTSPLFVSLLESSCLFLKKGCCGFCGIVRCDVFSSVRKGDSSVGEGEEEWQ